MKKITEQEELQLYKYYTVREDSLFLINRYDLSVGELYCLPVIDISNPTEIVLFKGRRGDSPDPFYAFDPTEHVMNVEYYTPEGIKNYLLGNGTFTHWWEVDSPAQEDELSHLAKILRDALNRKNNRL